MKRILLVSSNITVEPYPVYPLGLAVIAAALAGAGHEVAQFDFLASGESEELLAERVTDFAPDYVCVSIRNLDNCDSLTVTGYPEITRRLIVVIREQSTAPVIVGGPAFSIMPEELLAYTGADYGIVGEGERLVCELISNLSEGISPPRILYSNGLLSGVEMISPLYSESMIAFYLEQSSMINLQTKRGCPHGCIYCSYPTLEGTRYRCRDPKTVVDDLERINTKHGVDSFFFTDSVFNDSDGHYLEVVEEIIRRNLSLRWCCYMRPEGVRRQEIALMKRSGLYAVELGTDAASDTTLRSLGKGFTFADALEANRACIAERLPCAHFVMFGGPGETMETIAEGLKNLDQLEHTVVFAFSGIRILPGTPLLARAVRDGLMADGASLRDPVYYLSPGVDVQKMNDMIQTAFRRRRDRIFPPSEAQESRSIMHRFGYRGLLWDSLIKFPKEYR
ncbi:MAG: lipid biosynthesis B12-binding/radical SAM protein [Desulfuromonadaceae bacterium]|nr:lipid biosynthesis B12-binding/radical SAM protein [Desulfuromonadaceae bacterium]